MNNLERDSKQYDVLMMETSTQEKTVRDGGWCVPVKHVAKLSRMRSTSTNTNIKFLVDPEEEDRDNDTTSDCLGSKQFSLKDDVSHKCSCCEADGMQWKRTQMSSSNPVRGDPLPDWLQPFDGNLVDEEEQRGDCVEVHEDMQDDDQERKGVVAQGERARPLPQPRLPSRQEVQEYEVTHILHRSWCVHCVRGAGRSDAHRRRTRQDEEEREQHMTTWSIDHAFMIDTGDLCTREETERVGWDKTRVGKRGSGHWRNPCTSCLGKRKRRLVDSRKDQG